VPACHTAAIFLLDSSTTRRFRRHTVAFYCAQEVAMKQETTSVKPLRLRSSQQWYQHFVGNTTPRAPIPWKRGAELAASEKAAMAASLQAWQLGETSDGRHLLAAARRYADDQRDPLFLDAVRRFIAEEQRHGSDLGRYLDLAGIPRVSRDWGDSIFRALRYSLTNMELWVTLVLMVETLALIFYRAVRDATGCVLLRAICNQILHDEVHHIRFQIERLAVLHRKRGRRWLTATLWIHRVLFTGIVLAVWVGHRRALMAGGFSFGRFWRSAWLRMGFAWLRMDPTRYPWQNPQALGDLRVGLATDR